MVEMVNIQQVCPVCRRTLFTMNINYFEFRPCEHYKWFGDLDSIGNDQIYLQGVKIRLLKK